MAWTYEEVLDVLGDEAQAVPGAIIVFRNKHITVAELSVGGGFSVTPEGESLLAEIGVKPAKPKQATKQAAKKTAELDLDLPEE